MAGNDMFPDEGFSSSQDIPISLEIGEEDDIFNNYFKEQPTLNDCSFHLLCAQASDYPEQTEDFLFENL